MNKDKQMVSRRRMGYDIMPPQIKQRIPPPLSHAAQQKDPTPKTRVVELKSSVPPLDTMRPFISGIKKKLRKIPRNILIACIALALVAIISLISSYRQSSLGTSKGAGGATVISKAASTLQHGTPDYKTILPADKSIASLGGWTRVSPPDRNPVFAYVDKIGSTQINVSQQPLPDGFDVDSDAQVEQLAQGYKANEKITAGSTAVHIGTSAKGPQSVIFSKNNLLILIKSSVQIATDQWAAYVNSLQ